MILEDACVYVHFAPPCGTASRARFIKRKGRYNPPVLRTDEKPNGITGLSPTNAAKVTAANLLYEITQNLCRLCHSSGVMYTVENPARSFMWDTTHFSKFLREMPHYRTFFHHCMYGSARRKHTCLVHNIASVRDMELLCTNDHAHEPWGHSGTGSDSYSLQVANNRCTYTQASPIALSQTLTSSSSSCDSTHRRPQRPRSPFPRQRSTTQNPKSRRTPSPYRRRSPARRPEPPRRHHTPDPPRRSRTPSRSAIVLTPAPRSLDPGFIPTPDADDTWGDWKNNQPDAHQTDDRRPRSPPGPFLQVLQQLHPWARFPTGLPLGTVMHQIKIKKNTSRSLLTNQETLTLKK